MERLTEKEMNGDFVGLKKCITTPCVQSCDECEADKEAMRRLKEYEDLEEQGLLAKLKFKVGDKVWFDDYREPCTITGFSFGEAEDYIDDPIRTNEVVYYYKNYRGSITGSFAESVIGKCVFLTEAEKALAEMEK